MSVARPMTPRSILALLTLALLAFTLPACERARQSLGLGKSPPDEFKIVSRAPLTVPDEFTLPAPVPGKSRPQELQPEQDAQAALFGAPLGGDAEQVSPGEQSVVMTAQVEDEVADIRDTVDQEYAAMQIEGTWIDDVIWWREEPDPTAVLIDPKKESDRLQNNSALGLPANEGDFEGVIVEPREKAIFEDIF
jgi:Protein of unknown function (DUF3035)